MSGFRDNTWFLQTKGTDYDLVPKASKRVPVVRTAWIEADGVPLPEPDPADKSATAFSWMTVHDYRATARCRIRLQTGLHSKTQSNGSSMDAPHVCGFPAGRS